MLALALLAAASACSHSSEIAVGETHTVASATTQRSSADWPCFVDESMYEVWLEDDGDSQEQNTIEENSSIWLSDGDMVKVLQIRKPDALRVVILTAPTSDYVGKKCWVSGYNGSLFSR
ncbi:MAG TPA: hypothetical protein VK755_08890 [Candidatus Acidoferrales bacterium]|nr:hypothetical protein [Candidatus Acidoferrales bacterium]